jgi:spore maturation protein CgeB
VSAQLKILFVGQIVPGSRTNQRIRALNELGHSVSVVSTHRPGSSYEDRPTLMERLHHRLRLPLDSGNANRAILDRVAAQDYDILWLERAVSIRGSVLIAAKRARPKMRIVWYAEDDMMNPHHLSRWTELALPFFDLWVTTKSMNARPDEMPAKGVRNVMFVDNSFDPVIHRPVAVNEAERAAYGSDVSFVGTYEGARAASLAALAAQGFDVRVWGNGWRKLRNRPSGLRVEERPVYDDEYAKVVCASRLNLCFLRKENRDLQTCRSIEIPAMDALMLHERNAEIAGLFKEDEEAVLFSTDAELAEKCAALLGDEPRRKRIAAAGHRRVLGGAFSHRDRLTQILARAWAGADE